MYRRNLNKKHRLAPAAIAAAIVGGVILGALGTAIQLTLVALAIIKIVELANRPDITIPVIYPSE